MNVVVDTPIWSIAFRRKGEDLSPREQSLTQALAELIRIGRAQLPGVIRQEVLSGIRDEERFRKLRDTLRAFEDPLLEVADYEEAASFYNRCRARGVAGSPIDLLICAIVQRRNWQIFTTDKDFERYGRILGVKLYEV